MHDLAVSRIYLEVGKSRVFACSVDWPGWCRSGRTEDGAMEALLDYADRYGAVVPGFEAGALDVVERVPGNGTTDFGAPDVVPKVDAAPVGAEEAARVVVVLDAALVAFARAVAAAPEVLPKGPRGGGRDRDGIADHVREANRAFARKLGIKDPPGTPLADTLAAVSAAVTAGEQGQAWPIRYGVRRIAWHLLDHAWELEDKS